MPSKSKKGYPEINEIREDLDSLRTNVVELTKHIRKDSTAQTREVQKMLSHRLHDLEARAQKSYKNMENGIKAQPGKSVAMAFAAGLVASMLFTRR